MDLLLGKPVKPCWSCAGPLTDRVMMRAREGRVHMCMYAYSCGTNLFPFQNIAVIFIKASWYSITSVGIYLVPIVWGTMFNSGHTNADAEVLIS